MAERFRIALALVAFGTALIILWNVKTIVTG